MPRHSSPPQEGSRSSTLRPSTLDRSYEYASAPPADLEAIAREHLNEQFGAAAAPVRAACAPAAISLISDHTHYSNGFALLMPTAQGTAVALRATEHGELRIAVDGHRMPPPTESDATESLWTRVVSTTIGEWGEAQPSMDVAVVSTAPSSACDALVASLSIATARAVLADAAAAASPDDALWAGLPALRRRLAACTGLPYSIALLIGAATAQPDDAFLLVDTATHEYLPVETAAREALAWTLLDPCAAPRDAAFHRRRRDQADEATALLKEQVFPHLRSFRELEHQDIPRAIDALPDRLTPVVRHLVTDNRRVQKMVAAMRRGDWQMVGALLLMSHASRRDDWEGTSPEADDLVGQVEAMTLEGVYGACMTGRGGYVLVTGQPRALPAGTDRLATAFEEQHGRPLVTMAL